MPLSTITSETHPYGFARTFGPLCSNDTVLKPLSYYKRNEADIRVESVV